MITVLLVDHPAALLRALRESLVGQEPVSVVGEASERDRALRLAEALRPQAIVLDAEMADMDVPAIVSQLHTRSPTSALVIVSLEPGRLAGQFDTQLEVEIVSKLEGVSALVAAIRRARHR